MVTIHTDDFTAGTELMSQNVQEVMIEVHMGDLEENWQPPRFNLRLCLF